MIVAGFGFRGAATTASLLDALEQAGGARGVAMIATAADKANGPAFRGLAETLSLPASAIDSDTLERQQTATHSQASKSARGTGSVAEAAALAAAGPGASLLGPRSISADRMATCALARGGSQ
ncbi:cobalt-precorrin 5A hydrolase [Roseivivax halotolerans]|uniref:Cobalt-precorrin 5A hydrolase n=1 Tax=Roseivivax halotolerans TaxID=93684 RepID=A0A1I5Z9I7_9RHOB|nr:cobalamin biosynthesis protein [Roseivivax halotolerans]SFQ53140.1 cobalt-precorrin 5A hydrolase [Roseivivax halotolerans]